MANSVVKRELNIVNVKVAIVCTDQLDQRKITCIILADIDNWKEECNFLNKFGNDVLATKLVHKPRPNELCIVPLMLGNIVCGFVPEARSGKEMMY